MRRRPEAWDISFISWQTFKAAMMNGSESQEWKHLASADLIVSGPDFLIDFMSVLNLLISFLYLNFRYFLIGHCQSFIGSSLRSGASLCLILLTWPR